MSFTSSFYEETQIAEVLETARRRLFEPIKQDFSKRRVENAMLEAYLVKKLLEEGSIRNAAGKAFQVWNSLLEHLRLYYSGIRDP